MPTAKVAVTIDERLLYEVDLWIKAGEFPNRSQAVQAGLRKLQEERSRSRSFLAELAKLDPDEEQALAEEGFVGEAEWPPY